jgi:hypothetical protein
LDSNCTGKESKLLFREFVFFAPPLGSSAGGKRPHIHENVKPGEQENHNLLRGQIDTAQNPVGLLVAQ